MKEWHPEHTWQVGRRVLSGRVVDAGMWAETAELKCFRERTVSVAGLKQEAVKWHRG